MSGRAENPHTGFVSLLFIHHALEPLSRGQHVGPHFVCPLLCVHGQDSRTHILTIHSRKMNLMRGINLKSIASKLAGASGAECKAVCTEAGMFALRERRIHVTQEDFEMAVAKVMKKDSERDVSLRKLWK